MKLWKITWSGLRGRKKDTRLLWLVVALAYLFITLSSTVIACMEATEIDQRNKLYGQWQVMVGGSLAQEEIDLLLNEVPGVQTNVLGVNDDFGVVGTMDEDLIKNAGFQLLEGRYPENDDEIIMESKQLVASRRELKVGDEVTISIPLSLYLTPEGDAVRTAEIQAREEALAAQRQNWIDEIVQTGTIDTLTEKVLQGGTQDLMGMRSNWLESAIVEYDMEVEWQSTLDADSARGPWGLGKDFNGRFYEDLTSEEQRGVIREYVLMILNWMFEDVHRDNRNPTMENNLLGMDDVTIRTQTSMPPDIETHNDVKVWLQKTYTLVGVIETYTDRWDCGNSALPNVFITEEMGEHCFAAMEAVYEMYPYLAPLDFEDRLVFFTGDGSEEDTFRTLLPLYNQCLEDREDAYKVRFGADEYGQTIAYISAVNDKTGETVELQAHGNWGALGGYRLEMWDADAQRWNYINITNSGAISGLFEIPGHHPPVYGLVTEDVLEENGNSPLRINRYAYPISDSGNFMLIIVVAVLFVTTMAAVLQIFITQIRRRMQRIAMLKAIGTTNRQTAVMLFFEFLFFLFSTMPVGVGLGLLGAKFAVEGLNASRPAAEALLFSVQPDVVLIGIAAGTLALFLGMAVPSLLALRIPLTGRMTVTAKVPARRRVSKKLKKQTFFSLVRRNMRANRSRTMGNVALSVFICTIAVLCTYIGYASFEEYRTDVQWKDRPDYILTTPAAMNRRGTEAIMTDLAGVGEIGRIDILNAGENITVTFAGMEESPFVQALSAAAENSGYYSAHFNYSMMELAPTGVVSDLYTTRTDSELYARLKEMISEGQVNDDAFAKGEEVILFLPMYHLSGKEAPADVTLPANVLRQDAMRLLLKEGGLADVSARSWAPYAFAAEPGIQVGDSIALEGDTVSVSETAGTTSKASGKVVRVGAIIYYFPGTGLYPLSEHLRAYTVIGSDAVMSAVYPKAPQSYMKNVLQSFFVMNEVYFEDTFGRMYFQLYANENATRENTDFYLESFAKEHAMQLTIFRESNQKIYNAAQNGMLLAVFLGFAAVLLSMLILDNAVASALEQERSRMGILQSMGISGRQFVLQQLYAGFLYAVIGLAAAHLVWLAAVSVFTLITGGAACSSFGGFMACLSGQALWQYPWQIHSVVCALCGVLCVWLQTAPMFPLLRYKPIENIKFRK